MSALPPVAEHPADVVAALWGRIRDLAGGLAEDDWSRDTPCAGWDVHDLLAHLSGVQTAFDGSAPQPLPPERLAPPGDAAGVDGWTEIAVAARRGWTPEAVRGELAAAAQGHEARLRAVTDWEAPATGPTGPTTEAGLYAVRCYDLWVHVQDLHEALGRPVETRDGSPAAMVAYGFVLHHVPWLYAKRAQAPDGSSMRLVLTAPAGVDTVVVRRDGRARFDPGADGGGNTLEAAPGAFTLLVSGRGDPERWQAEGALGWEGPQAEEFVRRARIFA